MLVSCISLNQRMKRLPNQTIVVLLFRLHSVGITYLAIVVQSRSKIGIIFSSIQWLSSTVFRFLSKASFLIKFQKKKLSLVQFPERNRQIFTSQCTQATQHNVIQYKFRLLEKNRVDFSILSHVDSSVFTNSKKERQFKEIKWARLKYIGFA